MAEFASRLDEINALAEGAPGFIWRLKTDDGDATSIQTFDDRLILVNLSVWESPEPLRAFVYRSDHAQVMRQRRSWFERFDGTYLVLWWVPAGHIPTVVEANERLAHLQQHGESPHAFSFARLYPSPGHAKAPPTSDLSDPCPALGASSSSVERRAVLRARTSPIPVAYRIWPTCRVPRHAFSTTRSGV